MSDRFHREPFKIESLFVNDHDRGMFHPTPIEGGFVRQEPRYLRAFVKSPDEIAYILTEDGDCILAIQRAPSVIVPMFVIRAEFRDKDGNLVGINQKGIDSGIRDRMRALFEAASVSGFDENKHPLLEPAQVEPYFEERFAGRSEPIYVMTVNRHPAQHHLIEPGVFFDNKDKGDALVIGVSGHAGIMVTEAGFEGLGLVIFTSRAVGATVRRPGGV